MMQQLGQYVVSLTSVALISGILLSVLKEGPIHSLIRLLSGILLIITAVAPLKDVTLPDMTEFASGYILEGRNAAAQGSRIAEEERTIRIKEALEEYICDKASAQGAMIQASVSLDETGAPEAVQIIGDADQNIRKSLQSLITKELGIREENQEWIGQTGKIP